MQKTKLVMLLLSILLFGLLLVMSFWANGKALEINGLTRMIKGLDGSIYIVIDNVLARISSEGKVLQKFDIKKDLLIDEFIADIFVEPDGTMMLGLSNSQQIKIYSPNGKLLRNHSRVSSPMTNEVPCIKFVKDKSTGTFYVADSVHHRIQIYSPDEKEIKTITGPIMPESKPVSPSVDDNDDAEIDAPDWTENAPFKYPNDLYFENGRLFVADTHNHRIVIVKGDGSFDQIISTPSSFDSRFIFPLSFAVDGTTLFVVNHGPGYEGGEIVVIDPNTGSRKIFISKETNIDPGDIVVRDNDILVSDQDEMTVFRMSKTGKQLGKFGHKSLEDLLSSFKLKRSIYTWIRWASVICMGLMLVILLFRYKKERSERSKVISEIKLSERILKMIGPVGGVKQYAMLILFPGIGQFAAGRMLRMFLIIGAIVFFGHGTILSLFDLDWRMSFLGFIISFMFLFSIWTISVMDAISLLKPSEMVSWKVRLKKTLRKLYLPLIAALSGAVAQISWEVISQIKPEINFTLQDFFQVIIASLKRTDDIPLVFAAMGPANMLIGWTGAITAFFGTLAWKKKLERGKVILATLFGCLAGIICWTITQVYVGTSLGGGFWSSPVLGGVIALFVFIFFFRHGTSALIFPAAISGGWIGSQIQIFFGLNIQLFILRSISANLTNLSTALGAITRVISVLVPAYFICLFILIALDISEKNGNRT